MAIELSGTHSRRGGPLFEGRLVSQWDLERLRQNFEFSGVTVKKADMDRRRGCEEKLM